MNPQFKYTLNFNQFFPMQRIDLRSDTVTRPTEGMLQAMSEASVGDDVYAEDPTVSALEERVAELLGKERALFVPTGVMSNQLCLKVLTAPGDEVIVGEDSHIFNYETGAPALLSGVQLHTVADRGGAMLPVDIDAAIREDAYYLPRTAVIAVEQTHNRAGGAVIPIERLEKIARLAEDRGIALHLDGARLWNACVATGVSPKEYATWFDTVSVCLSKGLGAPVGSVMASTADRVEIARRFRKIWGGGWRQAGYLAAAGLYALDHHVDRLVEDHRKASVFADILANSPRITIGTAPQTNIVVFTVADADPVELTSELQGMGVLVSAAFKGKLRAVFHYDVSMDDAVAAAQIIAEIVG